MPKAKEKIVSVTGGGHKGAKPTMMSKAPPDVSLALREILNYTLSPETKWALGGRYYNGNLKYDSLNKDGKTGLAGSNWSRGLPWSFLCDAMLRHWTAFCGREDMDWQALDSECFEGMTLDGMQGAELHITAVLWSCIALTHYQMNYDRSEIVQNESTENTLQVYLLSRFDDRAEHAPAPQFTDEFGEFSSFTNKDLIKDVYETLNGELTPTYTDLITLFNECFDRWWAGRGCEYEEEVGLIASTAAIAAELVHYSLQKPTRVLNGHQLTTFKDLDDRPAGSAFTEGGYLYQEPNNA